ncbi:hypothetical protein [Pseudonocardia charpentierae]|uniref:Uncharacterized protein n=1 Tax=Pseudonocardia charpentierae TaxID=3075545 RepID=A0ABU2NHZ5_9PSEU|nr:hypothetical protein [Pseudonocardia sp. DSM 45834]MDT0353580.1 hypothetical protein [Pseudonocardia sp. DSM 45834]
MGLLDELMGGGEQQQSFREFADRYSQGAPYDGISDDEAVSRYGQVAGEVDPATYRDSARDALANMAPDERELYAQQLGTAADQQGIGHGWDGRSTDPDSLAAMTSTVHQQNPDLLSSLLGGTGGGAGLGSLLGGGGGLGGLLGGGEAGAGGGLGGLLGGGQGAGQGGGNPVMKAALAGIAAMAARRMMGGGSGAGGLGGLLG